MNRMFIVLFFDDFGFFDDYVFGWYVLVVVVYGGGYVFDFVDYVYVFDYFVEDGIVLVLGGGGGMVEEIVVGDVDEELCVG